MRTGEEVYSLAILLREEGLLDRTLIYATDINPEALRKAEAGIYELDRIAGFSESLSRGRRQGSLSDYYTAALRRARCSTRRCAQEVVFSDHSLATDSVFAEVQLVSCRNVLIYFDRALQDRASGCSGTRSAARASWAWARRRARFLDPRRGFTDFVREERIYQRR